MRTTIAKAGRIVIPQELRAQVGLTPGDVSVTVVGSGVLIEPLAHDEVVEKDGFFVFVHEAPELTVEALRELRVGDQR